MIFPFTNPTNTFLTFGLGRTPLSVNPAFKAKQSIDDITVIIGSSVLIDARQSQLDTGDPPTFYFWRFSAIPIGSSVPRVGFESLESDDSVVSFIPDATGFFRVELIISDGVYDSNPVYSDIYVKIIDVPTGQGLVPDGSFIWDYLGDFWNLFADKRIFSLMWSSYIQVFTNRLLSLYQIDNNKSINTIQDFFQRKWLNFNPELQLEDEDSYLILGEDYCGNGSFSNHINGDLTELLVDQISIPTDGSFLPNLAVTPYGKKTGKRIIKYWDSAHNINRFDYVDFFFAGPTKFNLLFTKKQEVINSNLPHPWRLCYTLGSFTKDFEQLGVKVGDRLKIALQIAVDGKATGQSSFIYLPIIAVSENQLGFSFAETLQTTVQDTGLSNEVILQIAKDLQIDGVTSDLLGNVIYLPNTIGKFIHDVLLSVDFKRKYFEDQLLITELSLGYFQSKKVTILAKPVSVFRYKAISIPEEVISIPTLQEYIEQPGFSETPDGKKYVIKDASQREVIQIYRNPLFLFENLDFITSKEELEVQANFAASNQTVFSTFGDFVDRSIEQGDILRVTGLNGNSFGGERDYTIIGVRASELDIQPLPTYTTNNTKCKIIRRLKGNYLRFVDGAFKATGPLSLTQPPNLWSEVTYFDNGKTVEDNFGILVSITREQLKKQQIKSPYKAAVAGLLYGLAKGPSIQNLKIGAQILLGLPFTYYKGIIREIKPDYQLGDKFEPKIGRVTIEETDTMGNPTGLTINYFYPQGAQILTAGKWVPLNPLFSGLAINPLTGIEYKMGDVVEQFSPLSKGIEVIDYLSDPTYVNSIASSFEDQLRKYHTIYLRANTDIFNGPDFVFVSNYLRLVKPAYLFLKNIIEKDLQDDVNIEDKLTINIGLDMFDINGLSLPAANKFDYYNDSPQIFTMDGRMFTRYIKGFDLVTSVSTGISQAGGFVTQRINELHDSPYVLAGDRLVIYNGTNNGIYDVTSVTDDQTIVTTGIFDAASNQTFSLYREVKNPITTGSCSITNGNTTVTLPAGDLSTGIAVGDSIFFYSTTRSRIYRIVQIVGTTITLETPIIEATATRNFVIYREGLLTTYLLSDSVTYPFTINFFMGNPWADVTNSYSKLIVKKGDTLQTLAGTNYEIVDFNETANAVYLNPTPGFTGADDCQIVRNYIPTGFSVDINTICIQDVVELELLPSVSTAVCISGNAIVTFSGGTNLSDWNVLPGDFFKLYTGTDSGIDIGYGLGVYVIAECTATQVTLTRPLLQTQNTATYSIIRRRETN